MVVSNPAKPPGYFGNPELERRLIRFMRYGGETALTRPDAIGDWSAEAGDAPGLVLLGIGSLPKAGDRAHWGDGRGVIEDIILLANGVPVASLGGASGNDLAVVMPADLWGETVGLSLLVIGSSGPGAASGQILVTIPAAPALPAGILLLLSGGPLLLESGAYLQLEG